MSSLLCSLTRCAETCPCVCLCLQAVYQFIISFPLLIPTGFASGVAPADLPSNLLAGLKCYVGINTVVGGAHPDDCSLGPIFVNVYILFNLAYNVLIILLIKYGSSNILWLCITLQVPIANLAFALPFMPNSTPVTWEDGVGLLVIMAGLIVYRFYTPLSKLLARMCGRSSGGSGHAALLPGGPLGAAGEGVDADGLLAVGAESPSSNVGGSTPVRGMHTHVARGKQTSAADKAAAVAAARRKVQEGGAAGAGGRARGDSH